MATASTWNNVTVSIQSALASADTITGITKASPGVVTATSHGVSNGEYIVMDVEGMHQLDGRVFRAANVTANTLELEGENTTSYSTFTSGTFQVITFGTTLTAAVNVTATGGDFSLIDITTIHDVIRKQIPGVAEPSVFTFDCIWDPSDAGLAALKSAADNQALRAIHIAFASGYRVVFNGYVGATLTPTGTANDLVKTNVVITAFGRPTAYAT